MAIKVIVNHPGACSDDKCATLKQSVADALGVPPEDVCVFAEMSVSVVEVPDALQKERAKADAEAAKAAEKQRKEEEGPPPEPAPPADYEAWTLADLHAEATKRDLAGRSALDKAGLVKALQKDDKAKG